MARRSGLSRADAAAIAVPRVTEHHPLYASSTTKQTKTQESPASRRRRYWNGRTPQNFLSLSLSLIEIYAFSTSQ
ncbi:hypothetical protein J3E68DRAFT_419734 [Trichoderma sp. SZMC 28012]